MKILSCLFVFKPEGMLFLSSSCTTLPLKADNGSPAQNYSTIKMPSAESTTTAQIVAEFLRNQRPQILALLALLFLMIFTKLWEEEKRRLRKRFTHQDLALLKIIKDNAARIWRNQNLEGTIVRIEDWREDG